MYNTRHIPESNFAILASLENDELYMIDTTAPIVCVIDFEILKN